MNSTSQTVAYTFSIVVPLVVTLALGMLFLQRMDTEPDIARAAARASALFQTGDLVVLYPRERYPDLSYFDEHVDAIASATLPLEAERFQRVILVHARGVDPPALRRSLGTRATRLLAEDVGTLTVELYQLAGPERVVFDLSDQIETATVMMNPRADEAVECPWIGDRFDCPDADWTWVGDTEQVLSGEPFRCTWSHPIDSADLEITFDHIEGTHVTGWYALTDYAVSIADGSAVRVTLEAGDERGRYRAHRQLGRRPLRFELPEDYEGPLTITISAARPGVRHFCWDLQVVDAGVP